MSMEANNNSQPMPVFTFGLSLRGCVRLCAVVGIFTSSFYVTAGVTLLTRAVQEHEEGPYSKPLYLYLAPSEKSIAQMAKMRHAMNMVLGTALVVINVIQILCDTLLFQFSLKIGYRRSLYILFIVDIFLWTSSLVCFISIFPQGGLLLMTIVLVGTSVRCYILCIIYQYFNHIRKPRDSHANLDVVPDICKIDPFITT